MRGYDLTGQGKILLTHVRDRMERRTERKHANVGLWVTKTRFVFEPPTIRSPPLLTLGWDIRNPEEKLIQYLVVSRNQINVGWVT